MAKTKRFWRCKKGTDLPYHVAKFGGAGTPPPLAGAKKFDVLFLFIRHVSNAICVPCYYYYYYYKRQI